MKYISFFSDENFYYCYYENGKIYRGNNAKKFVPNLKYFILIFATLFLAKIINSCVEEKLNTYICVLITFLGIVLSFVIGFIYYNKVEKKSCNKMNEIYLSEIKFNEYIIKGKKQFEIQKFILFFMWFFVIVLFLYFNFSLNLLAWFLGIIMCFLSTLAMCWIKPLKKQRFYKKLDFH